MLIDGAFRIRAHMDAMESDGILEFSESPSRISMTDVLRQLLIMSSKRAVHLSLAHYYL